MAQVSECTVPRTRSAETTIEDHRIHWQSEVMFRFILFQFFTLLVYCCLLISGSDELVCVHHWPLVWCDICRSGVSFSCVVRVASERYCAMRKFHRGFQLELKREAIFCDGQYYHLYYKIPS